MCSILYEFFHSSIQAHFYFNIRIFNFIKLYLILFYSIYIVSFCAHKQSFSLFILPRSKYPKTIERFQKPLQWIRQWHFNEFQTTNMLNLLFSGVRQHSFDKYDASVKMTSLWSSSFLYSDISIAVKNVSMFPLGIGGFGYVEWHIFSHSELGKNPPLQCRI